MPSFHLPHFNDIAILRSIEPNRFRTFLLRFDNYLCSQGFTIPETAEFTDTHLQRLIGIFNANDGSTPADMIEALFHISEVANDQGMEALLLVASKTGIELSEGDLTPADLALLIWLNDPDQLRRANCERIVLRFQSFYCFMNRTLEAPLFEMPAEGRIDFNLHSPDANIHRIGRLPPKLASAAMHLCVRSDDESLFTSASSLASSTFVVVLVPTLLHASIDVDALATQFKAIIVALDELIVERDGRWHCQQHMLDEVRNRLGIGETADVNSFRLEGENYQIRYSG